MNVLRSRHVIPALVTTPSSAAYRANSTGRPITLISMPTIQIQKMTDWLRNRCCFWIHCFPHQTDGHKPSPRTFVEYNILDNEVIARFGLEPIVSNQLQYLRRFVKNLDGSASTMVAMTEIEATFPVTLLWSADKLWNSTANSSQDNKHGP